MKYRTIALLAIFASYALPAESSPSPADPQVRDITCYVVMEEGASPEGNSLFLQKMGVDPEAVRTFAPLRFTRAGGRFSTSVQGAFGYQAGTPRRIAGSGRVALYEVSLRLKSDPPPRAWKTVSVSVSLQELSDEGGIVQASIKAMDKAAAARNLESGTAWIIDMSYAGNGKLKASVGLAR